MDENVQVLDLPKEFSPYPAGRFRRDGRYSGEYFLEDYLWPRLRDSQGRIRLLIDGVAGLPSSFWEEVFGGLVRRHSMDSRSIRDRVTVEATEPDLLPYVALAYRFADEAAAARDA